MLKRLAFFVLLLGAGLALGACGDDDGDDDDDMTDSGTDSGGGATCPRQAPSPTQLMGPCCSRASNADRQMAPELRLSSIQIDTPASLASPVVAGLLTAALNEERFNWLIELTGLDGTSSMIRTGYGKRNADDTFSFVDGAAPSPGDADRWNPVMTSITQMGESVSAEPLDEAFTLPIFDEMNELQLELPLYALELERATLSEGRNCVGVRSGSRYTTDGDVTTYIRLEDAIAGNLMVGEIMTTLCMFTAGLQSEPGNCPMYPRITTTTCDPMNSQCGTRTGGPGGACIMHDGMNVCGWQFPPDSKCDATGCTKGGCDPYDDVNGCNAWQLSGSISAHAVEITP